MEEREGEGAGTLTKADIEDGMALRAGVRLVSTSRIGRPPRRSSPSYPARL